MKRISAFLSLFFLIPKAMAGYVEGQDLNRVYVASDGFAYFGTATQPAATCYYFGEYFRFDIRNDTGKGMLSVLLAAKTAQKKVVIWYNDSTASGSNQTNGCWTNTLSVVTGIGVNQP